MDSDFSFQCLSHSQKENTMEKEKTEKRRRTMNVELAIQRELAYRKKIKDLQLLPNDDSGNEILSVEVQFPSPKSNQTPSSRPDICSGPRISDIVCEVCQVPCSGSVNYKQHVNGRKHRARLQELKSSREDAMEKQKPWCELCKIWCTDYDLLKSHFSGRKHKKMQERLEGAATAEEQNWCGIGCLSKELHFNGKKHKRKIELEPEECTPKGGEAAAKEMQIL